MSGWRQRSRERRERWWPVTAALLLFPWAAIVLLVLDSSQDLSGLDRAERRVDEAEKSLDERRALAKRRPELEREIAQLEAQLDELNAIVPLSADDALATLTESLRRKGAWDPVLTNTVVGAPPTPDRPWTTVWSTVRARPGGVDVHGLLDELVQRPLIISVRSVRIDDLADPDSPFTLELETYAQRP